MILKSGSRPAGSAKLVAGRLCLDFVNSVGGRRGPLIREDRLNDYTDLLAWGIHAGLLTTAAARRLHTSREAPAVYRRAIALREAVYRICMTALARKHPNPADLAVLNREYGRFQRRVRLTASGGRLVRDWADARRAPDGVLGMIADSAVEFLTRADLTRLRACGGDDCGWLFEDTTRNRSRRWCAMGDCGNVTKVRRFRSRRKKRRLGR